MRQLFTLTRQIRHPLQTSVVFLLFGLLLSASGCRTVAPFSSVDFTQTGWKIKSGQAVWKVNHESPEIAGEVSYAKHPQGRTVLQMSKNPFPMVIAQLQEDKWQIEFPTEKRFYSGRGTPHKRLAWLHLAKALNGQPIPEPWTFRRTDEASWRFENLKTGESIEGFLE